MSSQINTNIAEAIDVLITKRLGDLKLDTTIIAEIYSVINGEKGKYQVKYQSAIFEAYVEENNKKFRVGQSVYVRIPQSDFSQKKIITGRADNNTNEIAQQTLQNYRFVLEPTFHFLPAEQFLTPSKEKNTKEILIDRSDYNELFFLKSSNEYSYLQVEAIFKAPIQETISSGNYGIKIYFNVFDTDDQEYCLTLDTYSFHGRFYNFSVGTKQSKIFLIQRSFLQGIKRIEFFTENFDITTTTEISVRDIKLNFVDILDISEQEYYIKIQGLQGFWFTNKNLDANPLPFSATLLKEGKNVTNSEEYLYRWYYYGLDSNDKLGWHEFNLDQDTQQPLSTSQIQIYNFKENSRIFNIEVYLKSDPETVLSSTTFRVENAEIPEISLEYLSIGINIFFKDNKYKGIWYNNEVQVNNVAQSAYLIPNTEFNQDILDIDCDIYINEDLFDSEGNKIFSAGDYIGSWNKTFYYTDIYNNFKIHFDNNKMIQYPKNGHFTNEVTQKYFLITYSFDNSKESPISSINYYLNDLIIPLKENIKDQEYSSLLKNLFYEETETHKEVKIYYDLKQDFDFLIKDSILKIVVNFTSGAKFEYSYKIECIRKSDTNITRGGYSCRLAPSHEFYWGQDDYKLTLEIYFNGVLEKEPQNVEFHSFKINNKEFDMSAMSIQVNNDQLNSLEQGNLAVAVISYQNQKLIAYYPIPYGTSSSAYFEVEPVSMVQYSALGTNPKTNVVNQLYSYSPNNTFNFTKSGQNSYYIDKITQCTNNTNKEIIYQPVVCYLRSEEDSESNPTNWDGQILMDNNNNVISALRVSGGRGTEATFNGVTIGTIANGESLQNGIFGYTNGKGMFKITDNGIGYFGEDGKNQIIIDGFRQKIEGYSTNANVSTMTLNLAASSPDDQLILSDKFYITANGDSNFNNITSKTLKAEEVFANKNLIIQDLKESKKIDLTSGFMEITGKENNNDGTNIIFGDQNRKDYLFPSIIVKNSIPNKDEEGNPIMQYPQIQIHHLALDSTDDLFFVKDNKTLAQIITELYAAIAEACSCDSSGE